MQCCSACWTALTSALRTPASQALRTRHALSAHCLRKRWAALALTNAQPAARCHA
jgi:hypothetical protein